jgi:hypothetical protein
VSYDDTSAQVRGNRHSDAGPEEKIDKAAMRLDKPPLIVRIKALVGIASRRFPAECWG